jgi:hypothetical protein
MISHSQQQRTFLLSVLVAVAILAIPFWHYTGLPFPRLPLRVLTVTFGTAIGVAILCRESCSASPNTAAG